jgi:TatD DNase family protein
MGWVDTHCHLQLDDRPAVELMERAGSVDWMVVPGIDAASSRAAIDLAALHATRLVATAGLHPHDADSFDDQWSDITDMSIDVAAIGETGLDYYRDLSPRDVQRRSLAAHIELSRDSGKPLIVHCRDAFSDVHEMIEDAAHGPLTVLHCWTGGPRWTRRFLDLEVTFSFAGPVAFETGDTVRLGAALVPPERALVETDTPYLAPPPHRSESNEPEWVSLNGAALARLWGMEVDEVMAVTTDNARRVFGSPEGTTG